MMEYIKFIQRQSAKDILQIINQFGLTYHFNGEPDLEIIGLANGLYSIDKTLCFIEQIQGIEQIQKMKNALILTNTVFTNEFKDYNLVHVEDARYVFIKLLEHLQKNNNLCRFSAGLNTFESYISSKATIHPSVILEDYVIIEDDTVISAGCVIKNGTYIGKGTIIRENCTVGCDGIGLYKAKNGDVLRFPHIAGVYFGKNVEIGAGCVITRGTLSNTIISDNTVIGNLCNIGHGVQIGKKVWMSVGSLIGGNCIIGNDTTMGLGVRLRDNLKIGKNVSIGMGSVVTKSLPSGVSVFGNPAKKLRSLTTGPKR